MKNDNIPKFWEIDFAHLTLRGWGVLLLALASTLFCGLTAFVIGGIIYTLADLQPQNKVNALLVMLIPVAACGAGQWTFRFLWSRGRNRGKLLVRASDD